MLERYGKITAKATVSKDFLSKNISRVPIAPASGYTNTGLFSIIKEKPMSSFLIKNNKIIPSVTGIIRQAKPLTGSLLNWQVEKVKALGMEGFLAEMEEKTSYSSRFHNYIENTLNNKIERGEVFDEKLKSMENLFADVGEVLLTEADVVHGGLFYKGRLDCLAYYKNDLCLIDWKLNDNRKKDVKSMYDYPLQLAAYWGALLNDERFKPLLAQHTIKYAAVVNVHKLTGELDVHRYEHKAIREHWDDWLLYVAKFWNLILKANEYKENEKIKKKKKKTNCIYT
jgi:genome maintenance exonuclease 1